MCGDVLQLLQGGVALERFSDVLGALCTNLIVVQAARGSRAQEMHTSGGADSREMVCGGVPEGLERGVGLERRRDMLCALTADAVPPNTANGSQMQTSGGADSR